MTSQELIDFLSKYPDHEVLLSSDSEGNSYSSYDGQPAIQYVEKSFEGGRLDGWDLMDAESIQEDSDDDTDTDPMGNFIPVVVLYPV